MPATCLQLWLLLHLLTWRSVNAFITISSSAQERRPLQSTSQKRLAISGLEMAPYSVPASRKETILNTAMKSHQDLMVKSLKEESIAESRKNAGKPTNKKQRKESTATMGPLHWIEPSDKIIWEPNDDGSTSMIRLKVQGNPKPLVRHRTGRGFVYNPSAASQKSFQSIVQEAIFSVRSDLSLPFFPQDESLVMSIIFRMKRPKKHFVGNKPGPNRLRPNAPSQIAPIRTDVDNLTKFVLDSLNEVLYQDDKQVVSLHVTKLLDDNGMCDGSTEILVQSIQEQDLERVISNSFKITDR